jgi:hypothetical protein
VNIELDYTTVEECIAGGVAKEMFKPGTEEVDYLKCADMTCPNPTNIAWIWQSQVFKYQDGRLLMLPITLWFPLCPKHAPLQEDEVIETTAEEVPVAAE